MGRVLVTGGSGFIGAHCLLELLAAGHEVRTTVRDLGRAGDVRAMIAREDVEFVRADLMSDAGWDEAVAKCDWVLHLASPFPSTVPRDPDELIAPARDGALRVLRAARDAGVKRVVLTSSFAAIGYGVGVRPGPFTEEDWTNLDDPGVPPYARSKTIAERAAWEWQAREGGGLELVAVNPVGVLGPVLGPDYATSILLVKRLLDGALPGCPDFDFGVVDVRDVAQLHLLAMTAPEAPGERFLATGGDFVSVQELARILRAGPGGHRVKTRALPSWLVRIVARLDPSVKQIVPELGKRKNATSEKARRLLGWTPRSPEKAIAATAESLIARGLVRG